MLARIKKAEIYFAGSAPDDEKDKHIENFKELLIRADQLLNAITYREQPEISAEEILTGFK